MAARKVPTHTTPGRTVAVTIGMFILCAVASVAAVMMLRRALSGAGNVLKEASSNIIQDKIKDEMRGRTGDRPVTPSNEWLKENVPRPQHSPTFPSPSTTPNVYLRKAPR